MKKERVKCLDFVRAISMFIIVIFHFNCTLAPHNVYNGNIPIFFYDYINGNAGQLGVSLFFILSGASLMYNYQDSINIKEYFYKRWKGIFPMFYIAWIIGFIFYFVRYRTVNPFLVPREPWTIILTILGMDGYFADVIPNYYILGEWFLGCIILLYVLFPILLWIYKKIGIDKLLLISVIFYIMIVYLYNESIFSVDKLFLTRILDIVFGMFFIIKLKKIKIYQVLLALIFIFIVFNYYIPINQMYKISLSGMALFIILGYIGQKLNGKIMSIFQWFSSYSYSIFLVHHIVIDQVCTYFDGENYDYMSTLLVFGVTLLSILICAVLLQKLNKRIMIMVTNFMKKEMV